MYYFYCNNYNRSNDEIWKIQRYLYGNCVNKIVYVCVYLSFRHLITNYRDFLNSRHWCFYISSRQRYYPAFSQMILSNSLYSINISSVLKVIEYIHRCLLA